VRYAPAPNEHLEHDHAKCVHVTLSVNRPVAAYSGARYPMAVLYLSVEKTTSSARSLCRSASARRRAQRSSRSTLSAEMLWWTTVGLLL
jgi:hypothetical protein